MNRTKYLFQNLLLCSFIALASTPTSAQIIPDNTLGQESSQINTNVLINNALGDKINGGATRGSNLFHSFSEFNIDNGQRVYFSNPSGVQNILTRVTGGNASFILGTLGVDGAANLFLMNPNGILFGQNARLDVRGSFVGTTANSIIFPSGVEFSATNPSSPLLTISAPIGLQMGLQPGPIVSQSVVRNQQGNAVDGLGVSGSTLALIGGEIALDDSLLYALDGQVQLLAMGGATIGLQVNDSSLDFSVPENAMRSPITFTNGAYIYTSGNSATKLVGGEIGLNGSYVISQDGGSISINATGLGVDNNSIVRTFTQSAAKGGDIQIQARNAVTLANSSIHSETNNAATGNSGNISIAAENITVALNGTTSARSGIGTFTNSQGNAGNLTLDATDINVTKGGFVVVLTNGAGNTGNLTVRARESVNITDRGYLALSAQNSGSTGNLRIETGTFKVENTSPGVAASSSGSGSAGSIFIQARDAVEVINGQVTAYTVPESKGRTSDITIETQRLNLKNGGRLITNTYGAADAGNVVIRASKSVEIGGVSPSNSLNSNIASNTAGFTTDDAGNIIEATGNGGNITIETPRLTLSEGAEVSTSSVQSRGNPGNITIRALDVELDGFLVVPNVGFSRTKISTNVLDSSADVKGGTLSIDTERLRLSNGGYLETSVQSGRGQAGNLVVRASDSIDISGVGPENSDGIPLGSGLFAQVQTEGNGSGGSINVETKRLNISNGGQISAETFAQGNAGNILINANLIDLRGKSTGISTGVYGEATGNAGDIRLNTQRLDLQDGAYISSSTSGNGSGGNLTIRASDIVLNGAGSALFSSVEEAANGNGGTINIGSDRLTIRNGAGISSRTSGQGRAGDIRIDASDSITLDGIQSGSSSFISARSTPTATKGSGDITLNTNAFRLNQGANILATTANTDPGGNVTINANTIDLTNGGQILTSTSSSGQAGNITLNADRINLAGVDSTYTQRLAEFGRLTVISEGEASGLFANTTEVSSGKGGTIRVNTPDLNISDRAHISVNSRGTGMAGNIDIKADTVSLSDRALIIAETASQDGGSINIDDANLVLLRRNSLISATAAEGGNGGNVDINSKFIVALPKENSNIRANAFKGRGGNINITTQGIFGITSAAFPTPGQSNITASSELGVQGQINITQPDVDPTQGIIELPTEVIDASNQIGQLCPRGELAFRRPLNKFIVTGRDIPPSPLQPLPGKLGLRRLASLDDEKIRGQGRQGGRGGLENSQVATTAIVEAKGFVKAADGTIMLVAQENNATPSSVPTASACPIDR